MSPDALLHACRGVLLRAWRSVRWYLREWSGESRWDRYVAHCELHGHGPVSRREFERARADDAERVGVTRCC